jgi:acyl-CoA reductase-like NAD-dependent aldehyde dehydrogenase
MHPSKLLIDGKLVEGERSIGVIDPSTGQEFARCGAASMAQLDAAVAAARAAQPAWWRAGHEHRQACLNKIADILEAQSEPLARLIVLEQGKTLGEAQIEMVGTVGYFRYYAGRSLPEEVLEANDVRHAVAQRRPHGVVAAIVPWNYPVILMVAKVAPALLVGNAVVVKPAPTTPLSTLLFGELVHDVLPPGVLNIIVDDNDLGDALTSHPGVQKISFTGSTVTGRKVMSSAAPTLKRLTLELGGNDPALVLDDADPDAIAATIYGLAFPNAGQLCVAIKRMYVPDAMYDRFCGAIAGVARQTVIGSGLDPQTTMGPLQNRKQHERVLGLIEDNGPTAPSSRAAIASIVPTTSSSPPSCATSAMARGWWMRSSLVRCGPWFASATHKIPSNAPTLPCTDLAPRSGPAMCSAG